MRLLARLLPPMLATLVACASADGVVDPGSIEPCRPQALLSVGKQLPDCSFEGVGDGPAVSLATLRGKPMLLNFWASWCVSCIREMPAFQNVYETLGREVHVLGMNTLGVQGETRAAAEAFSRGRGVTFPLAYDEDGLLYAHFGEVRRPILPLTVFVDATGTVRHIRFGELFEEQLLDLIELHLMVG